MPRTAGGLRTQATARLADLEQRRPEWAAWLRMLVEVASEESEVTRHQSRVASRESRVASHQSRDGLPLLHQRVLRVVGSDSRRLIIRLVKRAAELDNSGSLRDFRPSDQESVELIAAAVRQDRAGIAAVALASGVESGALASVAHLAALPLLRTAGRELQGEIPPHWPHGYCPVCAAWPVLAERRGLDRSRRLRCGRCASEWEMEWLTCVYCGERDHQRLGSLVSEDGNETVKVETCDRCKGYLKSIATLQAFPSFELLLRDLETVELDLIALERGYARLEESGFTLEVAFS